MTLSINIALGSNVDINGWTKSLIMISSGNAELEECLDAEIFQVNWLYLRMEDAKIPKIVNCSRVNKMIGLPLLL